jgi:diguanylate cyclase (GGDEF)-like protein
MCYKKRMPGAQKVVDTLIELTRKFTHDIPLEQVLREITGAVLTLLPGNHCSIRILNDEKTELVCGARSGEGVDSPPMVFRRGEGVIGWVVDYGRAVNIWDTQQDPRFKPGQNQGFGIRSIAAVPVRVGEKVIGVLAVTSARPSSFSVEDLALVQLLANCSVPIIEKTRLERLSPFDDLTLAYKEIQLVPRLAGYIETAARVGQPLSLAVLGLDRLDQVYKKHDFAMGNRLLRRFADRVRELSHFTHWLARRGVDSFVLIMPDSDPAIARQQAEELVRNLDAEPLVLRPDLKVEQKASVGVATWNGSEAAEDLLFRCEESCLQARREGGNRVLVSASRS